jgi:Tol biopolymer transport system component
MQHWVPFDEADLYRLLRADRYDVWRWLRDDTRNLAALAFERGWDPAVLADRLVAPWQETVREPARLELLRRRALRVLTQGHLSQHILFHSLHEESVPGAAPDLFGVASREQFATLRRSELSPMQICRLNGLPADHARQRAAATLRAAAAQGVRRQAMPAAQARRLLARQLRQLPRWLNQSRYNGPPPLVHPRPSMATAANFSNNAAVAAGGRTVVWEGYDASLATVKRRGEINVLARRLRGNAAPVLVSPPPVAGPVAPRSSYNPVVSADGRFVAYESADGNLNFGKRYGPIRVLVRDLGRGTTRELRPPSGGTLGRTSYAPAISADGRTVAFASYVTSPLREGAAEIWIARGSRLSRLRPGAGLAGLGEPELSGDGRFVVYAARAGAATRLFRTDLRTGATRAVSPGTADEHDPDVSGGGTRIAYTSLAGGRSSVLVADLRSGTTRAVPRHGLAPDANLSEPALSADGRTVAFTVRGGDAARSSVWAADLAAGTLELVSRAAAPAAGSSSHPSVSADGRLVAFTSDAWNLSPAKCDAARGVFVRDRRRSTTRLLSVGDGANRYLGPARGSSAPGDMTIKLVCAGEATAVPAV